MAQRRNGECEEIVQQLWKEYRERRKAVKVLIREEKNRMRKETLEKIKKQGGASSKLFWADLKGKKKQTSIASVRSENGEVVEDRGEVLEVLANHWEELGRCTQRSKEQDNKYEDQEGGWNCGRI